MSNEESVDYFLGEVDVIWATTPWSVCSKPCETGIQFRKVFCALRSLQILSNAVSDSKCSHLSIKPNSTQFCATRSVAMRNVCWNQAQSERHVLTMNRTREETFKNINIRKAACEEYGCCFVPLTDEKECYVKELTEIEQVRYADWVPLAWGRCEKTVQMRRADPEISRSDIKQRNLWNMQSRMIACAWPNGTLRFEIQRCIAEVMPPSTRLCDQHESSGMSCNVDCHYGRCEQSTCICLDGWAKDPDGKCTLKAALIMENSVATPSWETGAWSTCEKTPPGSGIDSTGVRGRIVTCKPSSTVCYTASCDTASKPAEFEACNYTAIHEDNFAHLFLPSGWTNF